MVYNYFYCSSVRDLVMAQIPFVLDAVQEQKNPGLEELQASM